LKIGKMLSSSYTAKGVLGLVDLQLVHEQREGGIVHLLAQVPEKGVITQLGHCRVIYLIVDEAPFGRNRRNYRAITYVKVLVIDGELLTNVAPGLPVD